MAGDSKAGGSAKRSTASLAYRVAVAAFSLAFVAIGLVVLVVTLVHGGGPASVGVLIGVAFLAVGMGRLWVGSRMGK